MWTVNDDIGDKIDSELIKKLKARASKYEKKAAHRWNEIKKLKLNSSKYITSARNVEACLTSQAQMHLISDVLVPYSVVCRREP